MELTFTLTGKREDLDWVRTRVDGAIQDVIDEAVEEGRIGEDAIDLGWEYDD